MSIDRRAAPARPPEERPGPAFKELARRLGAGRPKRVRDPEAVEASVAAILARRPSGALDLLLIQRAARPDDPWSGQMALPGGRKDASDPDPVSTALRETLEETGLELPRGSFLGALDEMRPRLPSLPPVLIRPFVFGLRRRPEVVLGPEAAAYLWVPLSSFERSRGDTIVSIQGRMEQVPAFMVCPTPVWGITHRIIDTLLPAVGGLG